MAESHVISGLVAKRSELSGLVQHYQAEIKRISSDLEHIDGAIKLFDPDYDLKAIKAKASKSYNHWFAHGEIGKLVLDALRSAAMPLSTRQISEAIVALEGLNVESSKEWDSVSKLVLAAAKRLAKKGIVKNTGRVKGLSSAMIWQIA